MLRCPKCKQTDAIHVYARADTKIIVDCMSETHREIINLHTPTWNMDTDARCPKCKHTDVIFFFQVRKQNEDSM